MDFSVSEEHKAIIQGLSRFIEKEVVPLEEEHRNLLEDERRRYDDSGRLVPEVRALKKQIRMKSAEAGFYTMFGSEALGGGGQGATLAVLTQEFLYKTYGPAKILLHDVVVPSPFTNGLSPVLNGLSSHLQDQYVPGIGSGEKTLCFALSEPDAGSDVWNMKTTAVKKGDRWVINGTKQWITNAPYADYCMLFAVTDPELKNQRKGGITCFFVDTKSAGFKVDSVIKLMGHQGGELGIVSLENLEVPEDHIIGEVDQGFRHAMLGVDAGRLGLSAKCIGLAEWATKLGVEYAKVRKTFGKPIAEHQAVQMMIAESGIDIYGAKNMVLHCAWKLDSTRKMPIKELSICKAFCTEMVTRVIDRSIQIHGALGVTNDLPLQEAYRWARIIRYPDGTSEIHRRTIAKRMIAGDLEF
jgi:acyl-CoA dehydrogenase